MASEAFIFGWHDICNVLLSLRARAACLRKKRYTPARRPYIMKSEYQKDRLAAVWLRRLSYLDGSLFAMSFPLSVLGQRVCEKKYTPACRPYIMKSEFQKDRLAAVWLRRLIYLDGTLFAMSSRLSVLGQRSSWKRYTPLRGPYILKPKFKKTPPSRCMASESFIFGWHAICNVISSLRAREAFKLKMIYTCSWVLHIVAIV